MIGLTKREADRLKNSFAKEFSDTIFPLINESRFSVIYSNNYATRPNNPVNVYFGLLMLKEIFTQSDEEALDSLMFDIRYQYALHTTSFNEQPVSKNSLSNFRTAIYRYNEENNVDLIQEEIESHASEFSKILNIDGRTIRMDSLMISTSAKKLSRLEIIYSCVSRLIQEIKKINPELLSEKFKPYLEDGHHNETIYRCKDTDIDSKLNTVTTDAVELFYICKGSAVENTKDYNLLSRMLGEQTQQIEGKTELKPANEITSESLQNPTDPDATYRNKAGKNYTGYVGNVVESFDSENRIITHYDLQKNTYSDPKFSKDIIENLGHQDQEVNIIVDGAYVSEEIMQKASANNINMVPTNLSGGIGAQSGKKAGCDKFSINEIDHIVEQCPMGHAPLDSNFKKGEYTAHFDKTQCNQCPNRDNCPVTDQKRKTILTVTETSFHRIKLIAQMGTEEYMEISSKRAGIEGIPSVLRRRYNIDQLPVRGLVRSKVWFGFKISAINCKRLIKSRAMMTKDTLLSLFYRNVLEVFGFQRSIAA